MTDQHERVVRVLSKYPVRLPPATLQEKKTRSRGKSAAPLIYLIGSLRNPRVPQIAEHLRAAGFDVFDNWYSAGTHADDAWRDYERGRGHSYEQALRNHSAQLVFQFDAYHLNRAHAAVLVLPAGRSGHLEAGLVSATKPVFMLLDTEGEPERLDVMSQFLHSVSPSLDELTRTLIDYPWPKLPERLSMTLLDAVWLAGVFEGDGCFTIGDTRTPRALLQMTDEDVVARAAGLMGVSVARAKKLDNRKQVYIASSSGLRAVELMRLLRPYMGRRRQQQIVDVGVAWLERRAYNQQDRQWWANALRLETTTVK